MAVSLPISLSYSLSYLAKALGDVECTSIFEYQGELRGKEQFEVGKLPNCSTILSDPGTTRSLFTDLLDVDRLIVVRNAAVAKLNGVHDTKTSVIL
jgi:hypothetical protein